MHSRKCSCWQRIVLFYLPVKQESVCKHKTAVTVVNQARESFQFWANKHPLHYTSLMVVAGLSSYVKRGQPSKNSPSENIIFLGQLCYICSGSGPLWRIDRLHVDSRFRELWEFVHHASFQNFRGVYNFVLQLTRIRMTLKVMLLISSVVCLGCLYWWLQLQPSIGDRFFKYLLLEILTIWKKNISVMACMWEQILLHFAFWCCIACPLISSALWITGDTNIRGYEHPYWSTTTATAGQSAVTIWQWTTTVWERQLQT